MKRLIIILLGIVLGIVAARFLLVGSWLTLNIWAAVILIIGYLATSRKIALWDGAIAGYAITVSFIISGYSGEQTVAGWAKVIIFSLVFSLLGALGGAIGGWIGNLLKPRR